MNERGAPEGDRPDVAALAARIAAGETIDPATLPPELAADPAAQKLLRFARVARAFAGNVGAKPAEPVAPDRIGPWKLLRLLGSGGMGDVWLGERADGTVEHRVAIKRVRGASPAFAQRLEAERRILAKLSHPNIARFIDAGVDATGAPWLALDYIDGETLNVWCERTRPALAERLRLFLAICAAVEHAHRHLVVHRDLKPANVLVDTAGVPHLLDFGVAKLLDGSGGELTAAALTPAYAAPEQLRGGEVSTATDVYALGLVLFRLLAGELPPTRRDAGIAQVMARLDEEETHQPSSTARAQATELPYAADALEGDLDAIVSKAIRALPEARYGSVAELAVDVRRHLQSRPVSARPPTRTYLFGRWVRRNAIAVGLGSAAVVALLVGAGLALWQAELARASAERARLSQSFMVTMFAEQDPLQRAQVARDPLVLVREGIERSVRELGDDPSLQRAILLDLVRLETSLGGFVESVPRLVALEAELESEPQSVDLARARALRARAQTQIGELSNAEAAFSRALPVLKRELGEAHPETLAAAHWYASLLSAQGEHARAIEAVETTLALARAQLGEDHPRVTELIISSAVILDGAGRFEAALERLTLASGMLRGQFGSDHPRLISLQTQQATTLRRQGRFDEAFALFEEAGVALVKVLPEQHPLRGMHWLRYGNALRIAGRLQRAGELFAKAERELDPGSAHFGQLKIFQSQLARDLGDVAGAIAAARAAVETFAARSEDAGWVGLGARLHLGQLLLAAGDLAEAGPLIEETHATYQRDFDPDGIDVARSAGSIGSLRQLQGRHDEAIVAFEFTLARYRALYGEHHHHAESSRITLADALMQRGREQDLTQARALVEDVLGRGNHPRALVASVRLARRMIDARIERRDIERLRQVLDDGDLEISAEVRSEAEVLVRT
jgi:serine/threonine-protein kinase